MRNQSASIIERISEKRKYLLGKDCVYLTCLLSNKWEILADVDRLSVIRIMIEEKHCDPEQIMIYLFKLKDSKDPYYRYEALNYVAELDGKNQRELISQFFLLDQDLGNRVQALLLLADTFRNQRDTEILRFALSVYDDPTSTINSRLIAGAAMMFQLDIPSDGNGRPAFWSEDEEELHHPAMLKAVAEARKLIG